MSRFYQLFRTKEERTEWEKTHNDIVICMRMTAKQLNKDLPHVDIGDYKYATVYRFKNEV